MFWTHSFPKKFETKNVYLAYNTYALNKQSIKICIKIQNTS